MLLQCMRACVYVCVVCAPSETALMLREREERVLFAVFNCIFLIKWPRVFIYTVQSVPNIGKALIGGRHLFVVLAPFL